MHLSRLVRALSQPDSDDAGGNTSDDSNLSRRGWQASGSKPSTHQRPWKAKGQLTTDHSSHSQSRPTPPTFPMPHPAIPGVHPNSVARPSPEIPAIDPVPDKVAEAWDAVKDGPKTAGTSRAPRKSATHPLVKAVGVSASPSLLFFHALIRDSRQYFYESN